MLLPREDLRPSIVGKYYRPIFCCLSLDLLLYLATNLPSLKDLPSVICALILFGHFNGTLGFRELTRIV